MGHRLADLRYTFRSLRRAPLFTALAVASTALGIGANTAVFTLLDQVVLRPLPVRDPAEIVQLSLDGTELYGGGMGDGSEMSYAMYRDLRDQVRVFDGTFCRFPTSLHVGYEGRSERVNGELVSGTYFPVLGTGPWLGRTFTPEDDRVAGAQPVAVLSHAYWTARFAGDPGVVGRAIRVNGHPLTVVGVTPPGFQGLDVGQPAQLFVPVTMQPRMGPSWLQLETRRFRWVQIFARLRPPATVGQAQARIAPFFRSLLEREMQEPEFAGASGDTRREFLKTTLAVKPASRGRSGLRDAMTRPLAILAAVALFVLLISCANVANLLLARGAARERELALRLALGAGRGRVVRLLLAESLVVACLGGFAGLVLAAWGVRLLLGFYVTADNPLAVAATPDLRIVAFAFAAVVVAGALAGLLPALRSSRLDLAPVLKASGGSVLREEPRLRKTLVVGQVALSFLLLVGAGLFLQTLRNLLRLDPGFAVGGLVTFSVDLERSGYTAPRARQFAKELQAALGDAPGTSSAAYAFMGLLEGGGWGMGFTVEGHEPRPGEPAASLCNAVSPGFFGTMGIPLVSGRDFDERDEPSSPPQEPGWPYRAGIVNETFVTRYFGGASPLGRRIGIGSDPGTRLLVEIVGVAKDSKYFGVREDIRPQVYFPYQQSREMDNVTVYVRTAGEPAGMVNEVRRRVARLDPALPLYNVRTLEEQVRRSVTNERLIASLSTVFGALATLLSVVGLYGVIAYTVARRTREIGIRIALGASASDVALRVLREGGALVGTGLALGLAGAWWAGTYVQSELYGVKPTDVTTMVFAAALLALVAEAAALGPARRAARVDPMAALRQD